MVCKKYCISHTCTQQDCSPLWNEKVTSFGYFTGKSFFFFFRCHMPIVISERLSYVFQDKAFQQKLYFCKAPLSFHSFTGDFSAPCTCGFWWDTRPKSMWIQLPGEKKYTVVSAVYLLLWHCYKGREIKQAPLSHISRSEYWPRFNTSLTANRRSFPSTVKSCQKLTCWIWNVSVGRAKLQRNLFTFLICSTAQRTLRKWWAHI